MEFAEEAAGLAEARGQCYSLLSLSFCLPTLDLVRILKDGEPLSSLLEGKGLLPISCQGLREVTSFLQEKKGEAGLLQELSESYVKLFFASPHFAAPPYESVYVAGGFLMGEPALRVKEVYHREGLELARTFKDLPDHIAAEFEFMAFLAQKEAAGWEEDILPEVRKQVSKEEAFLKEHLCRWLPDFSRRLSKTGEPFYSPLAQIADNFTRFDLLHLSALVPVLSGNGEGLD